jgi:type II secretory pathway component PulF
VVVQKFLARSQVPSAPDELPRDAGAPQRVTRSAPPVRLSLHRRISLYGQMARMLEAGLPLQEVLRLLARGSPASLAGSLEAWRARLEAGASLAESAAAAPGLLPDGARALLAAGEVTGGLPASLRALAAEAEVALDVRRQILRAVIYPFVLFSLVFFVPRAHLLVTSGVGAYLAACALPYLFALGLLGGLLWGLPKLLAALLGPDRTARLVRSIPLSRGLLRLHAEVRVCRELAVALEAGLGMAEALRLAGQASGDPRLRDVFGQVWQSVGQGTSLHEGLAREAIFDAELLLAVAGGERAGRLVDALQEQARLRQASLGHRLQVTIQLLSVAILLATYAFVAGRVVSEFEGVLGGQGEQIEKLLKEMGVEGGGQGADLQQLLKGLGGQGQGKGLEDLLRRSQDPAGLEHFPEDVRKDLLR